jgi:hypothetical protein
MDASSFTETNQSSQRISLDSNNHYEQSVIEMTIDSWRLQKLFLKITHKLDAGDQTKYQSQLRYFRNNTQDILERFGFKLVDLEGQKYDGGMAVSALNITEFEASADLIVDQMTEPVIMGREGLKRMGTVLLRRVK